MRKHLSLVSNKPIVIRKIFMDGDMPSVSTLHKGPKRIIYMRKGCQFQNLDSMAKLMAVRTALYNLLLPC